MLLFIWGITMNKELVYKLFLNMCDVGQQKIIVKDVSFNIKHTYKDVTSYYNVFGDSSNFVYFSINNVEESIDVSFSLSLNNQSGIYNTINQTYDTINQTFDCHENPFAIQRRLESLQKIHYMFYGI